MLIKEVLINTGWTSAETEQTHMLLNRPAVLSSGAPVVASQSTTPYSGAELFIYSHACDAPYPLRPRPQLDSRVSLRSRLVLLITVETSVDA